MYVECSQCGNPIPARLVNQAYRAGLVVTGALCHECSPTGNIYLETDLCDPEADADLDADLYS